MKKCPYCAEEIKDEAAKCRFCGEFLDKRKAPRPSGGHGCLFGCLIVIISILLCTIIFVKVLLPQAKPYLDTIKDIVTQQVGSPEGKDQTKELFERLQETFNSEEFKSQFRVPQSKP